MTPLEIDILLHYYTRPGEYGQKDDNFNAPAVQSSFRRMESAELLEMVSPDLPYKITERGKAYIDAFCKLPLPEQYWAVPLLRVTP